MAVAVCWVLNIVVEDEGQGYARALDLNTIVVIEIFYLFSVRYLYMTSLSCAGILGTPAVWLGVFLCVLFRLAFTYLSFFNDASGAQPISLTHDALVISLADVLLLILELEKWLRCLIGWPSQSRVPNLSRIERQTETRKTYRGPESPT